jgi:hypothetical protein
VVDLQSAVEGHVFDFDLVVDVFGHGCGAFTRWTDG